MKKEKPVFFGFGELLGATEAVLKLSVILAIISILGLIGTIVFAVLYWMK